MNVYEVIRVAGVSCISAQSYTHAEEFMAQTPDRPDGYSKRPPASLFALGYATLPEQIEIGGRSYRISRLFKHDFFAATGLYESHTTQTQSAPDDAAAPKKLVVLKVQRTYPLYGLPMRWLGALVARHEIRIFKALQGIEGIPEFLGETGKTGYIHEFIPGEDLRAELAPDGEFFRRLEQLIAAVHSRHVAYVDANKRENILYGVDQRPYLIDFQISFICRRGEKDHLPARWILLRLQKEDWYHFYKHKTRMAPKTCSPEDFARAQKRSWYIRIHRFFAQPLIRLRRRFLRRYQADDKST
jgi:hypothetical protein